MSGKLKRKKNDNKSNVYSMADKYPFADSATALCFEAEIQRMAVERDEAVGKLISKLAELSGVSERQIYNYRNGKTEIQTDQIKAFCKQFNSMALGFAWLSTFEIEQDEEDEDQFDLSRFASQSVRNMLQHGDQFLGAFDDGKVDGHEMKRLRQSEAAILRDSRRMTEIAFNSYKRTRRAA